MSTMKEMLADGWVKTTINGVKCIKFEDLIAIHNKQGYMDPEDMLTIIAKLGNPYQINTLSGRITTLEYDNI